MSVKSAFHSAGNIVGSGLTAIFAVLIGGAIATWFPLTIVGEEVQGTVVWILATILLFASYLLGRALLVAPFQVYRDQKRDSERLEETLRQSQKQLHDIVNADLPDLPFADAIELARKMFPDVDCSSHQIGEQIVRMAFMEKIVVWGQPTGLVKLVPMAKTPVKIPHQFFYSPNFAPTELNGYLFEIHSSLPGWHEWQYHEEYLNVMVNRSQLEGVLCNWKPGTDSFRI